MELNTLNRIGTEKKFSSVGASLAAVNEDTTDRMIMLNYYTIRNHTCLNCSTLLVSMNVSKTLRLCCSYSKSRRYPQKEMSGS